MTQSTTHGQPWQRHLAITFNVYSIPALGLRLVLIYRTVSSGICSQVQEFADCVWFIRENYTTSKENYEYNWYESPAATPIQYIPRNMHTVFALLCFVVVIHWLIFPYPSGLLHWHCGNLTIAPVPAKQPWWIWIDTSCEFIMNDCITTTKQSPTKPCAYFLGYTVVPWNSIYFVTYNSWLVIELYRRCHRYHPWLSVW